MKFTNTLFAGILIFNLAIPPFAPGQARWSKGQKRTTVGRDREYNEQDHIGSVHVTVTGVELWSKVSDSLKTNFKLDENTALTKVIPTTQIRESQLVDAMKTAMKIAGPTVAVEDVATRAVDAAGAVTTTSNETVTTTAPDASALPDGEDLDFKAKTAAPAQLTQTGTDIGRDPFVEYRNAAALYQSVNLLNKSIDLATKRNGMTPYLVTLQITLMPYTRTKAYDTYSNISFFPPRADVPVTPASASGKNPVPTPGNPTIKVADLPIVVPILVTDNLEAATQKSASNIVRQFSLAAAAMTASVGGQVELDTFRQNIDKLLGEDLNSLITVARVADNVFRVRLGANHQASTQYTMVPQAHTVAALMLVPDNIAKSGVAANRLMQYQSYTSMRDANYGREATPRPSAEVFWKARKPLKAYTKLGVLEPKVVPSIPASLLGLIFKTPVDRNKILGELYLAVIHGKYDRFVYLLEKYAEPVEKGRHTESISLTSIEDRVRTIAPSLWSDLNQIWVGSKYARGEFEVPLFKDPETHLPNSDQTPVLVDDGVVMSVQLVGATNLKPGALTAVLTIPPKPVTSGTAPNPVTFTQRGATMGSDGTLRLTFPSLQGSGLTKAYPSPDPMTTKLALSTTQSITGKPKGTTKYDYKIAAHWNRAADVVAAPKFDLRVPSHRILSDPTGVGAMQLIITNTTGAPHYLEIAGCDITAVEGDAIAAAPDQGDYKIVKSGSAILKLSNLSQYAPVTVIPKKEVEKTVGTVKTKIRVPVGSILSREVEKTPAAVSEAAKAAKAP